MARGALATGDRSTACSLSCAETATNGKIIDQREQFVSREKFLFQTGEGPYKHLDADKAFALLVDRCETRIAAENSATLKVLAVRPQESVLAKNT
jgi:hypothetical protein